MSNDANYSLTRKKSVVVVKMMMEVVEMEIKYDV